MAKPRQRKPKEPGATPKTTIVDVAKAAGVSVSVVSRVLMGKGYVQAQKRERILRTMRDLDYHPSPLARGLRDRRTNALGLVFFWAHSPVLVDFYQREILAGVLDACVSRSYQLLISNFVTQLDDMEQAQYELRSIVSDPRVEGLLVLNPPLPFMDVLRKVSKRVLLINRQEAGLSFVDADQHQAVHDLVQRLAGRGHKRIGLLAGNPERDGSAGLRIEGFRQSMAKLGLDCPPELVWDGAFTVESGREGASQLLKLPQPPTALVASTDHMAHGAMEVARQLGRKVDVVGIDDMPESGAEGLTTMRQPFYEMGKAATETLIKRIAAPAAPPLTVLLPMKLMERKSG